MFSKFIAFLALLLLLPFEGTHAYHWGDVPCPTTLFAFIPGCHAGTQVPTGSMAPTGSVAPSDAPSTAPSSAPTPHDNSLSASASSVKTWCCDVDSDCASNCDYYDGLACPAQLDACTPDNAAEQLFLRYRDISSASNKRCGWMAASVLVVVGLLVR